MLKALELRSKGYSYGEIASRPCMWARHFPCPRPQLLKVKHGYNRGYYELVEGVGIDKLASILSKTNLYI